MSKRMQISDLAQGGNAHAFPIGICQFGEAWLIFEVCNRKLLIEGFSEWLHRHG